jgi:Protein of unknown function (DUF1501)
MIPPHTLLAKQTRRHFFGRTARGLGTIALSTLLHPKLLAAGAGNTARALPGRGSLSSLHLPAKAKRVIYLFQSGAPSQLDLYDYKPKLIDFNGKPMPESYTQGQRIAQLAGQKLICVGTRF